MIIKKKVNYLVTFCIHFRTTLIILTAPLFQIIIGTYLHYNLLKDRKCHNNLINLDSYFEYVTIITCIVFVIKTIKLHITTRMMMIVVFGV